MAEDRTYSIGKDAKEVGVPKYKLRHLVLPAFKPPPSSAGCHGSARIDSTKIRPGITLWR